MPFLAKTEVGNLIVPEQADSEVSYTCPSCESELRVRSSHTRGDTFVSSHFWHTSSEESATSCGGESDQHKRMKSIAMSKANNRWPDATVTWESEVDGRRADVLVEFPQRHSRYGEGIAIECQHKHEDKDIAAVNQEFTESGYSVLWRYERHNSEKNVDLDSGDWVVWWVKQIPKVKERSGYHGVVHWLSQSKPTSVELDLDIPIEPDRGPYRRDLRSAWERGYRTQMDRSVSTFLPCGYCGELVSHQVVCDYPELGWPWRTELKGLSETRCSNCGLKNKATSRKLRMQLVNTRVAAIADEQPDANSRALLPCPQCQNVVEFRTEVKANSTKTDPWCDLSIEPLTHCPDCDEVVKVKSNNIRLVGKDFERATNNT